MTDTLPLIVFVPGMKPKPHPSEHSEAIWRCLVEGVRKVDPDLAAALPGREGIFSLAAWTHLFYNEFRNISDDLLWIDAAIRAGGPTDEDREEARSLKTKLKRASYLLGDTLPFLIPRFADEDMQITLRDVRRYLRNDDNVGRSIRRNLRLPLRRAWHARRPILLIGHSLGSVIAWDTLWEMSRVDGVGGDIELFMTMGSPLGQRVIQRALKGSRERGRRRYPDNIRHWVNIAAMGELTALDHQFKRDFSAMEQYGLVKGITDHRIYSHYREGSVLRVHSEYGYLLAETTGTHIADFLRPYFTAGSAE